MSFPKNEIFLSLTDMARAIKKGKILFYLACLLCGNAAFLYFLTRPIKFVSEGIFKGQTAQTEAPLFKALEFLSAENSYFTSDDSRVFLRCRPVLEEVVSTLNLQASIDQRVLSKKLREVWYTLKITNAYRRLKKQKPLSSLQSSDVYVPHKLFIPDASAAFTCSHVCFLSETATSLKIHFLDEKTFSVFKGRKEVNKGHLERPFIWSEGSFILAGKGKKGKTLSLNLIPMEQAVNSLKKRLKVTKDKENSKLIHVSFTHRDRHLAAAIVNETMEQYQNYLKGEGKKKITKQLAYLHQRQEETMASLDAVLQKHKSYLESSLSANTMISLENELQFMAQKQCEKKQIMLEISSEMEHLSLLVWKDRPMNFSELIRYLHSIKKDQNLQALTVESARNLIHQRQHELDLFCLENARYDYCLCKLSDSVFDSSSLAKTLDDNSLKGRFEKIHSIHRQLIDEENWSEKEKDQLKAELETEKLFLIQHIGHLKEGATLQTHVLQSRIKTLQLNLLFLLLDRFGQTEHSLDMLNAQAAHFPQKWFAEQKIELSTKLSVDMMESITKMIEVKNIGYNLDYLMATPLSQATAAVIPENPHLFLGTLFGSTVGCFIVFLGICLYQIWLGPTASSANLMSLGRPLLPEKDCVPHLGLTLKGGVVLISSKTRPTLFLLLAEWLIKRGESIFTIDLNSSQPFKERPPFTDASETQAFLASVAFQEYLCGLKKQYDRTLILYNGQPQNFELCALILNSDLLVYGITNERLAALEKLPDETLFFIQEESKPLLSLSEIQPLVAHLLKGFKQMKTASYFSSAKKALQRFLLKKT